MSAAPAPDGLRRSDERRVLLLGACLRENRRGLESRTPDLFHQGADVRRRRRELFVSAALGT